MDGMNSLLAPSTLPFALPDYAHLTDAQFAEALEVGMAEQLAAVRAIAQDSTPPSVENVLHALETSGATLARALDAFWVARSADTNDERDAIAADFAPTYAAHHDTILLDAALYARLRGLKERADAGEVDLDEQDAWLLSRRLYDHESAGVALSEQTQARLRELNGEIASLQTEFERVLTSGRNAAAVHITDEAQLAGVPDADRAALAENARARGLDGWLIAIVNTTGQPILDVLADRALRERVFRASVERGLGGEHDTRDLVVGIARRRAERATLLGYPHAAAVEHEDSCAGSTDAVTAFLQRVAPPVVRLAEADATALADRFEGELQPWDWQFVAAELAGDTGVDPELVKPYLEYERVLHEGVFAAATELYGITFHARDDLTGYTNDARVYEVREEDGSTLGALVIDPYTRPTKKGGAWMTSLVAQSEMLGDLPVVTNTCNVPPPASGSPSLLTWDNVITLFHEFGHDLHGLLSDVRYPSRSGPNVPRDFVEFPSQVNEMWAFEPALIRRYAVHHETGEPLPESWVDALVAGRQATAYRTLELLKAMILDQAWHQASLEELPADGSGVEEFERAALERAGVAFPLVPPRYRSAYFSHIFGGGYVAGYYSYLWSEVMDADAVAWFAEQGTPDSPTGMTRQAGERFRRELLARGGSVEAMETYRRFRGGDPDITHLLRRLGVPD
ncbi:MAG: M3 family metallopeptidase [Mobilicoccus sp.]|nr:M3 family metallopeptidase [Mobilicoccus sp.]